MAINSQFLFSYIDELIRSQWIEWSERFLSSVPVAEFHTKRGFQEIVGADNSFVRTRALECFRLGLINSRLISERAGSHSEIPEGWRRVCAGSLIHTRLGYFAYVVGKALDVDPENRFLNSAANAIATLQILLIGFQYQGRWYSTVNLFNFSRTSFEGNLGRSLNDAELRYLSGALFNTLDGTHCDDLIRAYVNNSPLPTLFFAIRESKEEVPLTYENIGSLLADDNFNINSIEAHKAALFWSNDQRGVYARASEGSGYSFLTKFLEIDKKLAAEDRPSIVEDVLESINHGTVGKDLVDALTIATLEHSELSEEWEKIIARLEDGVVKSIETLGEEGNGQSFFAASIKGIRQTLEDDYEEVLSLTGDLGDAEVPVETSPNKRPNKRKIQKELILEELKKIVLSDFASIFTSPPPPPTTTNVSPKQKTVRKFDQAQRDAKNRELGTYGEDLVVSIEIERLKSIGRHDLAGKVKWISKDLGDGAGYDILSYDETGSAIYIEVKATRGGISSQFYLSENELQVSIEKGPAYRLYRVYNMGGAPRVYIVTGALDQALNLKPISYRAHAK